MREAKQWIERVKETEKFHKLRLASDSTWTIRKTASLLNRSYGSVNEDLQLANWLETHPRLATFKNVRDALKWMRNARFSIRTRL